jgi:hypothetical protein
MMRDPSVSGKTEKLTSIQESLMFLPLIIMIPYKPWLSRDSGQFVH